MRNLYLLMSPLLFCAATLYGNVALPSLYYILGISSVSHVITLVGFLLEYACICIATRAHTRFSFLYALVVTFFMNLISAFVGIIFRLFSIHPFYTQLHDLIGLKGNQAILGSLTFNDVGFGIALWIIFTIINTIIEMWVTLIALAPTPKRRILFWTFMANALSNGFGIVCLGAYKYLYGSFPFNTVSDYFMTSIINY